MNLPACSRRDVLIHGARASLAGICLPTVHGLATMHEAALENLPANPEYRALVCVLLHGGNDAANLIVPRDTAAHALYATARGNLAVAREQLLPITPIGDTRQWGLHPSVPELRTLFEGGKLAVVANVGTLLQPITRAQYLARSVPRPAHLFSHSDQTTLWQLPSARAEGRAGWGGRLCDLMVSLNSGSPLSPAISVAGSNRLLQGQTVVPYAIGQTGATSLYNTGGATGARRLATLQALLRQDSPHVLEQQLGGLTDQSIELSTTVQAALAAAPALATTFPSGSLANQLKMVARLIGVRQQIGALRQVFFVRLAGWDTHDNQLTMHPQLLQQLSQALAAFQNAMVELGTEQLVTTATLSEFGRSLTGNGRGSDHGWGGHALVLGGAVLGRRIFGTMPDLALGGPDDAGAGRFIPTTAVEQYAATLARWFGVASNQLGEVFPRLSQFSGSNLGFLG